MKIQLLSDLHIEGCDYTIKLHPTADVLVLAGDICNFANIKKYKALIKDITIPIIAIPGNHEFYVTNRIDYESLLRSDMVNIYKNALSRSNVHFLDNEFVMINGVKFVGSTLWSNLEFVDSMYTPTRDFLYDFISRNISDFHVIPHFSVQQLLASNLASTQFIKENKNGSIVVSHFAPSIGSLHARFKNQLLNSYFINDFDSSMFDGCKLWMHGHTHDSFDYMKDDTRIVCNPKGYQKRKDNENKLFEETKLIKI